MLKKRHCKCRLTGETYGNTNVGRQITVDILLEDGSEITCRLDNLVKDGNKYKIIDAKSSIIKDLSKFDAEKLIQDCSTINQQKFYDALKKGHVKSIKPRGQNAIDYFQDIEAIMPTNLNIESSIDFLVNDVITNGSYKMYIKTFNF
jgi:hypothetical protein